MDSLPSSLLYFTQQLTNFTRNQIKINPRNTQTVGPGVSSQLRVALPVNSIANMKSLTLHCELKLTGHEESPSGAGNAKYPLVPKGGAAALIDRCSWSAGGVALDNSVTPYHVVEAVRDNLKKGSQKYMSDDKVLSGAIIDSTTEVTKTVEQAVTNFSGFTECEPTYLDLNLIPQLQCTIQTAPAYNVPYQVEGKELGQDYDDLSTATNANAGRECSYSLSNCFFSLEVIQIGSGMYDALTQRAMMERGSLDVPYPQFQVFQGSPDDVQGSVSCMSLDRIMFVQLRSGTTTGGEYKGEGRNNTNYDAYTKQQPPVGPIPGSTTFAFQQASHNFVSDDLETWQMTVNNAPMPLYDVHRNTQSFAIAMNADDRSYSNQRGGLVSSQDMWKDNCWCAVQRLKFSEDPRRMSGLNLSSINSQIRLRRVTETRTTSSDSTTGKNDANFPKLGLLITEQTSLLRIGPGRAISVVS